MLQKSLIREDDVAPLAESVLTVLDQVGILCQNAELVEALSAAGARVDAASQRVWFPRPMVSEFVAGLRAEYGALSAASLPAFPALSLPGLGGLVAQLYYDDHTGEARNGNREDFIRLIQLGDVLHPAEGVGHALLLTDAPPLLEPLEAAMLMAEYAHSPQGAFAWNVRQIDYLVEMGQALSLPGWFNGGAICISHPLRFDRDVADRFVRQVRAGATTGLTAMPVAGATTPVTVEGFVVVSSAEMVAGWFAARALNPHVPLGGSMWAGTVDMRSLQVSYCAPDAMFYGFAAVEFLRRWTGLSVPVGGGEYCSAKKPGLYTALEKAYKAMTIAAFGGRHPSIGSGFLDDGRMISPVQLLLDRDVAAGMNWFARDIEPNAENIALPTILEVGLGLQTSYVQAEHTLRGYRHNLWLPDLFVRSGWDGFESEAAMLDKARQRVDELVGRYRKPEGREEALAAMRLVVERARRDLVA